MAHPTGLAAVIEAQGRKLVWIAEQLDPHVHYTTVVRWANGEREIPADRVLELAELLGVTPDEIDNRVASA